MAELGQVLTAQAAYRHLATVFADGAWTLLKPLSWQGDLSLGVPRDGIDEAGPRAILAYLRTYGPATPDHVQYWLGEGLSAGRARLRSWFAGLGDHAAAVDVEGTTAYVVRDDVDDLDDLEAARPSETVRLLPGHDQWVIGPGTKDPHATPPALRPLMTRKANPLVVGGVVRGTWARTGDLLAVTWRDAGPRPDAAIAREAARLRALLDRDLELELTSSPA